MCILVMNVMLTMCGRVREKSIADNINTNSTVQSCVDLKENIVATNC